ncbi:major facilitator superfamily domain-containing protein [Elsinoe ampelina]|uniref:Major facilitator superfamily domain-containing protein n=1 Tax=Elsinoe ampelina TaxID=302913 RepID=A0A6A6GN52_9PEZI|nr:major facilitator superfamily domain-containing protein [Elsinoe ampelina]
MRPTVRPTLSARKSSTLHYQTFPTAPPTSRGKPPPSSDQPSLDHPSNHSRNGSRSSSHHESPLPKGQLAVLAIIALAEQTALNSISPYLPEMAATFPEVHPGQVGLYVGLIASAFALAQFSTNFFWGWLSDHIGRKPVVLTGTVLTAACFVAFGFCRTLWQAILVQALMGLVNGNQGVISTCLGEITDRSNQSKAFTYLPVVYGIGGITGPLVGGLLVWKEKPWGDGGANPYPYLPPNLLSAAVLIVDAVITFIFLEESLEEARDLPPLGRKVENLFTWIWQFTGSSTRPSYVRRAAKTQEVEQYEALRRGESSGMSDDEESVDEEEEDDEESSLLRDSQQLSAKTVFNRDTILLLGTFLLFQLGNISFNSLYPIFGQADPPIGRNLTPEENGVSLGFAGAVTIVFQIGVFGKMRDELGNKMSYRVGLLGYVIAFFLMPFVGYKDGKDGTGSPTQHGKAILYVELGAVLIIKTISAVGCLTSSLLLITNSAPNHAVLGSLNGLAQTLSAAGRAVGPFISGALFTASTHVRPKGEAVAFGVFGGIIFVGFLLSLGIRGENLEAEGVDEEEEEGSEDDSDEESTVGR